MTVVNQIREALERMDGVSPKAMGALVKNYSDEVAKLNRRLSECSRLLNKGLRSEALQQANIQPNLFDWGSDLDFQEFEEWIEILQFLDLPVPTSVDNDLLRQLHEATIEEQPLEELLRQHRRLAIAKAPLSWRIKVLRAISRIDSMNLVWNEDLVKWEAERLRQLPRLVEAAVKSKNAEECRRLGKEIQSADWQNKPSKDLISKVKSASSKLHSEASLKELENLCEPIYAAFSENDDVKCKQLRQQWDQIAGEIVGGTPAELFQQVEPAFEWLGSIEAERYKKDAHADAVTQMEQLIQSSRSLVDLELAHQAVKGFGFEANASLEEQYQAVVKEIRLANRRKTVFISIAASLFAVLAIGGFSVWQWNRLHDASVEEAVSQLSSRINEQEYDAAKVYVESMVSSNPQIASDIRVQPLVIDLENKIRDQERLEGEIDSLIQESDNPDDRMIDLAKVTQAENLLPELVKSDDQTQILFELRRRKENADRTQATLELTQLKRALDVLNRELDQIEVLGMEKATADELAAISRRLQDLRGSYPNAADAGRNLVGTVSTRISGLRSALAKYSNKMQLRESAFERIESAQTLEQYASALAEFIRELPESEEADDFDTVLRQQNGWDSITRWNGVLQAIQNADASAQLAQSAISLLGDVNSVHEILEFPAEWNLAEPLKQELLGFSKRTELLAELRKQIDGDVGASVVQVLGATREQAKNGTGPQRFFCFASSVDAVRETLSKTAEGKFNPTVKMLVSRDGAADDITFYGPVSVSYYPKRSYEQILARIDSRGENFVNEWDQEFMQLLALIVQGKALDGTVKERLLAAVVGVGVRGSSFLNEKLQSADRLLRERALSRQNWFRPAEESYELAAEIDGTVRQSFSVAFQESGRARESIQQQCNRKIRWCGYYSGSSSPRVKILTDDLVENGKVFALRESNGEFTTLKLGLIQKGEFTSDGSVGVTPSDGAPVFMIDL